MNITFLGTGTSHGVPPLDCMMQGYDSCPQGVCRAAEHDTRHRRTRSSLLLRWDGHTVLVDAGPDLREQCLREKVARIDAVLITHGHADHIFGIPDIRSYTRSDTIPFYGSEESIQTIRTSFPYIFDPDTPVGGGIPKIKMHSVNGPFSLFGKRVIPVSVDHLQLEGCFGYRIGPLSYIPDVRSITPDQVEKLAGTEVLILNCLRRSREHASHLTLGQSVALARSIAPQRCYFIHMSHDIHYELDKKYIDTWMDFSYDGLSIDL